MDRRAFIKTSIALPAAVAASGLPRTAAASAPGPWRVFEVTTTAEILKPAGVTRVWLPVPLTADTTYQKSLGGAWNAEGGKVSYAQDAKYSMGIVHAEFGESARNPKLVLTSRFATRDYAADLSAASAGAKENPAVLRLNLEPTELIPTDGIVRDTAREITKGARTDIDKARAIYEWVVDNTFRDPKVRGCGWGDIKAMLETRNLGGKCGDLNTLFVGLARSVGVPARDIYGVRVARSQHGYASLGVGTENITRAQHCRAEFYAQGRGWVPVDPADVRKVVLEEPPGKLEMTDAKVVAARKRLFGSWEMNWLAYSYAHDVQLPGSTGPRIPYFMYPNGETSEGRLDQLDPDSFKYTLIARELKIA
ncbi:MAG: transglutaminase-like domain-containing protein [Thermodesulfobacteriota bacterium]